MTGGWGEGGELAKRDPTLGCLDSGATEKCSDGAFLSLWLERVGGGGLQGTGERDQSGDLSFPIRDSAAAV